MSKKINVSIIIPVIAVNDYICESVPKILEIERDDFEIIIFSDQPDEKHSWPKTRIIASGKVGPAEKRDLAIKYAKGDILAFIDDDAYPNKDWLNKTLPIFEDLKIGAVGGPAITPASDGILQKVSGAVFESYLGGGATRNRYLSLGHQGETEDWPTVNLLVRRTVFEKIGGFDNTYWPGEDTKLCLDIINAGYKIVYEPNAIVYHHRRSDLLKHFKQIGNYALHRGFFAKIYPKTSRRFFYFVPSLFFLYLLFLILILPAMSEVERFRLSSLNIRILVSGPLYLYCLILIIDAVIISNRWKNILVGLLTIPMILLTHIWYGVRFICGLIIPKLDR